MGRGEKITFRPGRERDLPVRGVPAIVGEYRIAVKTSTNRRRTCGDWYVSLDYAL
jgi:hypothetical protein